MAGYADPADQLVLALYVQDIGEAVSFFERLGFALIRHEGTFVELRWDEAPLFLVEAEGTFSPPPGRFGDLRIMVPDVDHYWELVGKQGLRIIRPIENRGYGLRDFIISGPAGLAIRFATRLSDLKK
jgi:catechol 2,3-dioxygenase-like lactoylglutathione lyase family enzyme